MTKFAVFASGTGTNFEALYQATQYKALDGEIVLVVVDKPNALVIEKAKKAGVETFVFNPKEYASKADYEKEILAKLKESGAKWIALAGYMRIIGDTLLNAYENRIINIHPSLLPAFVGKDAIGQAINYGCKVMGVTIHYVNNELDAGKIIAQKAFDVTDDMDHDEIEANIHSIEHVLYPLTLQRLFMEEKK